MKNLTDVTLIGVVFKVDFDFERREYIETKIKW